MVDDKEFISGVVNFLKDVGWIKEDKDGSYEITRKGRANTVE
jgi:predicted transcriptional regulator